MKVFQQFPYGYTIEVEADPDIMEKWVKFVDKQCPIHKSNCQTVQVFVDGGYYDE